MRDSLRYAVKEVWRRKKRTAGAILSYFFVGAIVVVVSSLAGVTRDTAQSVLWNVGAHSVAYSPRLTIYGCCIQTFATDKYDPDREGFVVNNAPTNIISEEEIELIRQSPYVLDASPYLMFRIRSFLGSGEWLIGGIDLTGHDVYPYTVVAKSQVVEGEFIEHGEDNRIMVEDDFAGTYGLEVGSELQIGDFAYEIAAIVNPPLRPGKANIYMSLEGLRELIETRLDEIAELPINAVLIESLGARYHDQAHADIASILGSSSRITSYGCYQPSMMAMGINDRTAWIITGIVILCMLLVAMKIQYSSVIQRRFDIGVLKAIGWRDENVVIQVMTEASIYGITGGIAGVAGAFILIHLLPGDLFGDGGRSVDNYVVFAGLLLPVAGGLLAGILSAFRAARLQTADILRKA